MVCQNSKCGKELKSDQRRFCSQVCVFAGNRGFPAPAAVEGARWIELGGHRWALVDEKFHAEITDGVYWSKTRGSGGRLYAHRYDHGREVKLHHAVMRKVLRGPIPDGFVVDHVNGDGLDCRASNLRMASLSEQNTNRRGVSLRTGFRGVYETRNGKFASSVRVNGCKRHLGRFETAEEAAHAYDAAARVANRSFARLNFPQGNEQSAIPVFVQMDEVLMTG